MARTTLSEPATAEPQAPAVPPAAPLAMPVQRLGARARFPRRRTDVRTHLARLVTFGGALAITTVATEQMVRAVAVGDMTVLQGVLVVLFTVTFGWIALSATTALAGCLLPVCATRVPTVANGGLCALVMPVYNEDPAATTGALLAMAQDLERLGAQARFEIFLLSDTTDPAAWVVETAAVARLRDRLAAVLPVWYRHRASNIGRKSGNLQDFVERWGGRYETMLVLDADSMMSAETLSALRDRMDADPRLGILQSVPMLAGRDSLFARLQQFAGRIHGPVAAGGLAAWQGDDGNYWGHNAIIRVAAFAGACGLPTLRGPKPFGGAILSHDFVEAALMRRAGWKVRMAPDLGGSWEAAPPSLLDAAARDRRWAQGNMQHLAVIGTRGLAWPSRAHLGMGVLSYLSSPLWLTMIVVGVTITLQARLLRPRYFTEAFQLFPIWPRFDAERMIWLFAGTLLVLLTPKIIGLVRAVSLPEIRRPAGGAVPLMASWIVEILLSALYAPIMMMMQTRQIWEILIGRDAGWSVQRRDDGSVSPRQAFARHAGHTVFAVVVGGALWLFSPPVLAWLVPTLLGLLLAAPLSWSSGSGKAGRSLRRLGLLVIPEEREPPPLLEAARIQRDAATRDLAGLTIAALTEDRAVAERHFHLAGDRPRPERGTPDVDRLTLRAKLDDAHDRAEALSWLSRRERMCLLGDAGVFAAYLALSPGGEA